MTETATKIENLEEEVLKITRSDPIPIYDDNSSGRGSLIVIEGLDKSGKTTQIELLRDYFVTKSTSVEFLHFPDRKTLTGQAINFYLGSKIDLNDEAIHLLFSANRWEKSSEISNLLNEGISVVIDRYAYSGVAFSSSKGMDIDWCKGPDKGLPLPDLIVFLEISVEDSMKRDGFGEERYEKKDFQKKVGECFNLLRDSSWEVIDASKPVLEVHSDIRKLVETTIATEKSKVIGKLWVV